VGALGKLRPWGTATHTIELPWTAAIVRDGRQQSIQIKGFGLVAWAPACAAAVRAWRLCGPGSPAHAGGAAPAGPGAGSAAAATPGGQSRRRGSGATTQSRSISARPQRPTGSASPPRFTRLWKSPFKIERAEEEVAPALGHAQHGCGVVVVPPAVTGHVPAVQERGQDEYAKPRAKLCRTRRHFSIALSLAEDDHAPATWSGPHWVCGPTGQVRRRPRRASLRGSEHEAVA
jgi:hypothetical protein